MSNNDITELRMLETLAFCLYMGSPAENKSMSTWRSPDGAALRDEWRKVARSMTATLEECGMKMCVASSTRLSKFVHTLMTQPAVMTYTLTP